MNRVIEAQIVTVSEDDYQKLFTGIGRPREDFTERAYWQHFGFSSLPPANARGIVITDGENCTMIATEVSADEKPALSNEKDAVVYADADKYIKVNADGEIVVTNDNNTITLKENGDIEIGGSNLDKLVKIPVLTTLAAHTHPVSGAVAGVSTDAAMITLAVDAGNQTQNTEAD